MDRLDDWHHRAGENMDFFCVGYVEWNEFEDDEPVAELQNLDGSGSRQFYYSARAFQDVRKNIETRCRWRYSGEADLLLVNVVHEEECDSWPCSRLEFDEFVALDIDKIVNEGVYASASRLMERVCQSADDAAAEGGQADVMDFSDREFIRTLFRGSLGALVKKLKLDAPLGARHFIVGAHLLERV